MKKGFTLAELLIVIAIVAILVSIVIVVFANKTEQARNAVDMTIMRQAKSAMLIQVMTDTTIKNDGFTRYYYYPGSTEVVLDRPSYGYGKSHTNVIKWWKGEDAATGTPCLNGVAAVLSLTIDENYNIHYFWGGAYSGQNILSQAEYQSLTQAEKIEKDKILLDSLQTEFRGMTYAQIREMFLNPDGSRKSEFIYGILNGNLCVTIAYSRVSSDGIPDASKDIIYVQNLFENVGFNTSLPADQTYIINSVQYNLQTIWVNLNIKENDLKNLSETQSNQTAQKAYTYLKSGGASTPLVLQESYRKNT